MRYASPAGSGWPNIFILEHTKLPLPRTPPAISSTLAQRASNISRLFLAASGLAGSFFLSPRVLWIPHMDSLSCS